MPCLYVSHSKPVSPPGQFALPFAGAGLGVETVRLFDWLQAPKRSKSVTVVVNRFI